MQGINATPRLTMFLGPLSQAQWHLPRQVHQLWAIQTCDVGGPAILVARLRFRRSLASGRSVSHVWAQPRFISAVLHVRCGTSFILCHSTWSYIWSIYLDLHYCIHHPIIYINRIWINNMTLVSIRVDLYLIYYTCVIILLHFFCCVGKNMVKKSNGRKKCLRTLFPFFALGEKMQKRNGANWR